MLLTVFTPTYNRAHTLGRTYESLCRQTCRDFVWLIVDDGSSDGTDRLVASWQAEERIPITYVRQENQGMHGAHNTAYRHITTELNTCIDSDDWMPDDAVERIVACWREHGSERVAGIVGLDATADGAIIGTGSRAHHAARVLRTRRQWRQEARLSHRRHPGLPRVPPLRGRAICGAGL